MSPLGIASGIGESGVSNSEAPGDDVPGLEPCVGLTARTGLNHSAPIDRLERESGDSMADTVLPKAKNPVNAPRDFMGVLMDILSGNVSSGANQAEADWIGTFMQPV